MWYKQMSGEFSFVLHIYVCDISFCQVGLELLIYLSGLTLLNVHWMKEKLHELDMMNIMEEDVILLSVRWIYTNIFFQNIVFLSVVKPT